MNTSLMIGGMDLHDELDCYQSPPPPIVDFPLNVLEKQLHRLKERAAKSSVMVRVVPDMTIDQMLNHYASMEDVHGYTCVTPWTGLNVSATGDVFPCFNYRMGNLREQPLMKLWNNERYRAFRRSLLTQGLFAGCAGCCDLVPLAGAEHPSRQLIDAAA
jgi:radical SAM protein with 4Fe4S-binding SPASM domain